MPETSDVATLVERLRRAHAAGRTRGSAWRREQLLRLKAMLVERESELLDALHADLGKSNLEGWGTEIGFTIAEAEHALKHLRRWLKPEKVSTPLIGQPGRSWVVREPLGVALIIGPWNYPIQLVLAPLVGAIAAGNCAVVKPSELASASAAALARWLPDYLDPECIAVVQGGPPETTALLAERFDTIFFTGGSTVGRIVLEAAAKHLTPVTLELGGKSPCLVDGDVDLPVAARRIAWGKFLNAGQTCVAPDYVLVDASREDELLERLAAHVRKFYGEDPQQSPDYGRIINPRHFERLVGLLGSGEVVCGGEHDAATRYLAPTILRNVPPDAPVMQEEIFGPILPVLRVDGFDEAVAFVDARPKPLALYFFSTSEDRRRQILERTCSGSVCINDVATQLAVPGLPFGGVGASGMGAYHGRHSFETFSHRKSVLQRWTLLDTSIRYPPYDEAKFRWVKRLL